MFTCNIFLKKQKKKTKETSKIQFQAVYLQDVISSELRKI